MLSAELLHTAAQRFGTPLYVYDAAELDAALARVRWAFGDTRVFFAVKANSNMSILRRMAEAGLGFDGVSYGELCRAEFLGLPGERIISNGPAKSQEEYDLGAKLGVTFIVDRPDEVDLLPPHSRALVRVNPALTISTHDHLATGSAASKFGVTPAQVPGVLKALRDADHTALGLHVHIGSAIRDAHDFTAAYERLSELRAQTGPLDVFDAGGGWGLGADLTGIAREAKHVAAVFDAQLWVEPGRYLTAQAGTLLTRVIGTKRTGRNFCLVDAGMTELVRPMMYGATHPVTPLWSGDTWDTWDIAGPACESGDLLAKEVRLPTPQRGDLLAVGEAGAYGAAMSSNYLTRPRPAEVLFEHGQFEHGQFTLVRKRETPADIWRAELLEG